jgi:hypothetical protein
MCLAAVGTGQQMAILSVCVSHFSTVCVGIQSNGACLAWPQAFDGVWIRYTALFCDVTQRRLVVFYRRFGRIYRWHLHGLQFIATCMLDLAMQYSEQLNSMSCRQRYMLTVLAIVCLFVGVFLARRFFLSKKTKYNTCLKPNCTGLFIYFYLQLPVKYTLLFTIVVKPFYVSLFHVSFLSFSYVISCLFGVSFYVSLFVCHYFMYHCFMCHCFTSLFHV